VARLVDQEHPAFVVQRRPASSAAATEAVRGVPPLVNEVLASPAGALDATTRAFFEPRLGVDLGHVRVHTGHAAESAAALVGARAFTVGRDVVFGAGQYAPATAVGGRLLAHELVHTLQPGGSQLRRQVEPGADDKLDAGPPATSAPPDATPEPARDAPADAVAPPAATPPATTPSGHTPAPPGMAKCPDPPSPTLIVVACTGPKAKAPPAKEKAELPTVSTANFGGDADKIRFAADLAQCWAEREVRDEIETRFAADVEAAKKRATEEAAADTKDAVAKATAGIDPKDRGAVKKATDQATKTARAAATKKIAEAQRAVTRQDVATVTAELAKAHRDWLAADYAASIDAALRGWYGASWLGRMQARLDSERRRITKEKTAKPKLKKGETPPPAKPQETIDEEIEAEMAEVRCDQKSWALDRVEELARAWAVGRREQVDFRTIPQKAAFLKGFGATYSPADADRVVVPPSVRRGGADAVITRIAPEAATFLLELEKVLAAARPPVSFSADNRPGHGGGSWAGKGFSLDVYISAPTDARGFWQRTTAINFLLGVDETARRLGARWRVLYNDFTVAQAVNAATGSRNVEFTGEIDKRGSLNWHGPNPLLLHFHLDLEIAKVTKAPAPPPTVAP
jgi:hypothetical protein